MKVDVLFRPVRREANYHLSKTPDTTASSSTSNVMGIVPQKEPSPKRYLFLGKSIPHKRDNSLNSFQDQNRTVKPPTVIVSFRMAC